MMLYYKANTHSSNSAFSDSREVSSGLDLEVLLRAPDSRLGVFLLRTDEGRDPELYLEGPTLSVRTF